jgi:TonB family protein
MNQPLQLLLGLPALLFSLAVGAVDAPNPAQQIPLLQAPLPPFPTELKSEPVYQGTALIGCVVAPDGSVVDAWALRASHKAFARSAEETVLGWKYAPAASPEKSAMRIDAVEVRFSTTGSLISQTQFDAIKSLMPSRDNELPPVLENLPPGARRPSRLEGAKPKSLPSHPGGSVEVEFFVDSEGRVRLPLALRSTDRALSEAAVSAVRQWRFEPLRIEGKPASLRTRYTFRFPKADS